VKNPISYSVRDGLTIQAQIDADAELRQTSSVWKKLFAGIFDSLSNTLNAVVNSVLLRTAYARNILQEVLQLIDYQLAWKTQSSATLTVNINPALTVSTTYTVQPEDIIAQTPPTVNRPAVRFEGLTAIVFSIGTSSSSTTVYQQTTQTAQNIGTTTGESWQELDLPDLDVLKNRITLQVGADTYTQVDTFANSTSANKVYRIFYRSDGSSYIRLPGVDDVTGFAFGYVPPAGQTVTATYAAGGGSIGNVEAGDISQYIGADAGVTSVSNPGRASGGANQESIANAQNVAPIRVRETGYFINRSTGESLARSVSGVLKAQIMRSGLLTYSGWIIPQGGGLPSTELKTAVQDLLTERSPLEEITGTISDPTYISQSIAINAKIYSGYTFSDLSRYCKLAILCKAHELADTLISDFTENGIESAIEFINDNFVSIVGTFSSSTDAAQVSEILRRTIPIAMGENLELEDIIAQCALVTGIDYVKVTSPTSAVIGGNGTQIKVISVAVTQI